jgi:4-hydroxybenzoate polyprenyltransferase
MQPNTGQKPAPSIFRILQICFFGLIMNTLCRTAEVRSECVPLVVDLDGTLIRSDLLVESLFSYLGRHPLHLPKVLTAVLSGKAELKEMLAAKTTLEPSALPFDETVLKVISDAKSAGQPVYLASASNDRFVRAVAEYLGVFDGWFGSSASLNLSSTAKADRLCVMFGVGGFDYIGNDNADCAVWRVARRRIAVRLSKTTRARLASIDPNFEMIPSATGGSKIWLKTLRVHQWAKNALVFVPLLTAQEFRLSAVLAAISAFLAFSVCASGIYILNDLVDLDSDRKHPTKRLRPLAAGTISVRAAMAVAPVLILSGLIVSYLVAPLFAGVLLIYLILTTLYTFWLKRKMLVDVVVLASLYTIRVIGGAAAISVPVSEWLLGFSLFMFTALALMKRYVELAARIDRDLPDLSNRNYRNADLEIVGALAAAAGFNAVTVFALYVSSETVHRLYSYPEALWLICPILLYWLSRALMMAHRRLMDDDPIVFALRDWNSLAASGLIGLILVVAAKFPR